MLKKLIEYLLLIAVFIFQLIANELKATGSDLQFMSDQQVSADDFWEKTQIYITDAFVTVVDGGTNSSVELSQADMHFYYNQPDSNTRLYFKNGAAGTAANMYEANYNVHFSQSFEDSLELGDKIIMMTAPLSYADAEGHMIWEPEDFILSKPGVDEWEDGGGMDLFSVLRPSAAPLSSVQGLGDLSAAPPWAPFEGGQMESTTLYVHLANGEIQTVNWTAEGNYTAELSNGLVLQYDYFVEQNEAGQWEEHIGFIVVPEPSSALLALGGLVGMLARRRRRIDSPKN